MKKDDRMLNEAYLKVQNKTIEEAGWISRQGARLGAMGGAVKQGLGDIATAMAGKPAAPDSGWRGKYDQGKRENILNTLTKNISTDLAKLGIFGKSGKNGLSKVGMDRLKNILNVWLEEVISRQSPSSNGSTEPTITSTPATTAPSSAPITSTPATTAPSSAPTAPTTPVASPEKTGVSSQATSEKEIEAPEPIPNEARITDKNGTVYEYDSEQSKWFIPSKSGGSLNPIPNDRPEYQQAITKAWNNKSKKAAASKSALPSFAESFKSYYLNKIV